MRVNGKLLFLICLFIFYCSDESSVTNESRVILPLLSHGNTVFSASICYLPADGISSCNIKVKPLDSQRIVLGEGLNVKFNTTHGVFKGEITYDSETGEYSQVLQSVENDTGTAVISASIINRHLFKTVYVDFYLGIYIVNKKLDYIVRDHLDKKSGAIYQEDLDTLFELNAYKVDLFDISEVIYCRNLKTISLINCKINYIPGISDLNSLEFLNLRRNYIHSVTPLENMVTLDTLDISFNQITDISSLSNLINLKSLEIDSNNINNINSLNSLGNLNYLSLKNNRIDNLSPISNLIHLTYLNVSENFIEDINPITSLTELKNLYLSDNCLIFINGIENLTNLEVLDLSTNYLKNISALKYLPDLNYLNLSNNNIIDVSPLLENPGLGSGDVIYLNNNSLSDESKNNYIPALIQKGIDVHY